MSTSPDPGLSVVARVRAVREQDSRLGLTAALAEEDAAQARVLDLEHRLATTGHHDAGTVAAFAARQRTLDAVAQALVAARASWQSAQLVAGAARDRWHSDRTRLAAVESLLERRAEARLKERSRREGRELDAIAEELWRRRQGTETTA